MVNVVKSCSVWPNEPNTVEMLSLPWNRFCVDLAETTRLKFRHLSMIGAIRLAMLSCIPIELMLMVSVAFSWYTFRMACIRLAESKLVK